MIQVLDLNYSKLRMDMANWDPAILYNILGIIADFDSNTSWSVVTHHSQECFVCFSPRFCKFEIT